MPALPAARQRLLSRIAASLLGGYAFTWGFVALAAMLLLAGGMTFSEASTLATMLGFIVFLVVFLWAFAAASVVRVWCWLAGGGAAMTLAGWLLSRTLT